MCNHKTLATCSGGYIFRCEGCGIYQLAYGTSMLSFSGEEFGQFRQMIRHRLSSQPCDGFPLHKCIMLELQAHKSYMVLCRNELSQLADLADEAWFAAELQQVITHLCQGPR